MSERLRAICVVAAALAIGCPLGTLVAILIAIHMPNSNVPPPPIRPSCQLGIALEVVDGQKWRETVVVCKGPQGEPIVLKDEFFVRADKGWR